MKSMTGYGSSEGKVGKGRVFIEIKSVNHRYCDIQLKIPPRTNLMDPQFRTLIKSHVERGKIDLFLKERKGIAATRELNLDVALAKKYHQCLEQLQRELGPSKKEVHLLEVIDARDLITIEDVDVDYSKYWGSIKRITINALRKLDKMRAHEGAFLLKDQKKRLLKISALVKRISNQSEKNLQKYKTKIRSKVKKGNCGSNHTKDRVESELSFQMEKMDISEELTRLKSHLNQYRRILGQKGAVGRQLDFLLQEMNREINTIGAKANDAKISMHVVTSKSELEKLREQVQNIE
jgi:uncharacterized protein (TIGR00255 family)